MNPQRKEGPVDMLVIYRAKRGMKDQLLELVRRHWPTLRELGLATATPARVLRARDREGKVSFVETFQWKDSDAPGVAHQTPEVMAMWEPMGAVMEGLEITEVETVA